MSDTCLEPLLDGLGFGAEPSARAGPDWPPSIAALVAARHLLSPEALARVKLVEAETGEAFGAVATRLGLLSESALAAALSEETGLALAGSDVMAAAPDASSRLSSAFLRDAKAIPTVLADDHAQVAFANPLDDFAREALAFALERPVIPVVARSSDIEAAIDRVYGAGDRPESADDPFADEADVERLKDMASDAPVIRAVNQMIAAAVGARASDIHVQPAEDRLVVRFRIDGVLHEQPALPVGMRQALVSRVKVMAGLNIAEKRLPQDGRLRLSVRGNEIDLRVATAPSLQGESLVMRILDRAGLALDFAALGFGDELRAQLLEVLHRPHGILLVTGPTGSGKTTTLYTALSELNGDDSKLLTVEDPIEYRLPGVVQTQVAPGIGLTFVSVLRSFLRQDPDVIMVGEIRDSETAAVAVQAALTGHVILSTLHTNTAASAIVRLIDMGVEPFLITSTLNAVLAQRLVRRLCPACAIPYRPDAAVLAAIGAAVEAGTAPEGQFFRAGGCGACDGTGFRGRIALLELLVMNDAVAALVLARASTRAIEQAARMRTLKDDGLGKARAGLTTIDEVLRVTAEG